MTKRITGFSREAGVYIERHPGQTAQEIVGNLLQSAAVQSAAQDPEGSLVATLHKHHRQIGVERRRDGGVYRYYPRNGQAPSPFALTTAILPRERNDGVVITISLPQAATDVADTLIATGTCKDRSEAVTWLVNKAISAIRLSR